MNSLDKDAISIPDKPIEISYGDWVIEHPDCDAVFDKLPQSGNIIVYAFATSKYGNKDLFDYRNKHYSDKLILKGVSMDGIRRLI